jgi:hypothetical protein
MEHLFHRLCLDQTFDRPVLHCLKLVDQLQLLVDELVGERR